jgi:hypothetical protein
MQPGFIRNIYEKFAPTLTLLAITFGGAFSLFGSSADSDDSTYFERSAFSKYLDVSSGDHDGSRNAVADGIRRAVEPLVLPAMEDQEESPVQSWQAFQNLHSDPVRNVAVWTLPTIAATTALREWPEVSEAAGRIDRDNADSRESGIEWGALLRHTGFFLASQHSFRLLTEEGTRQGMKGPFFKDWYRSLSSLHGWGDGDPFLVNYIGHPMQGSVAGYIWRQNDVAYRSVEFENTPRYWRSVLRSTAFSFVYSSQFEIGPISEATIGAVQSKYPQQGFVDHVATPTIGALWMVGEDILDRHVIRRIEGGTENVFIRMMARGWLNPSRSFANMMRFKVPWWRDTRPGIWKYRMSEEHARRNAERILQAGRSSVTKERTEAPWTNYAPFEFTFATDYSRHPAGAVGANCIGGSGTAVWNRGPVHSWVAEVGGCKLFTFDPDFSGDILTYRFGPRWTKRSGRWMPYGQVLVGGKRATVENIPEERREEVRQIDKLPAHLRPPRWHYVDREQSNGFALSVGGGLDVGISRAASLRLANFDYTHAWLGNGTKGIASYPHSVRWSMGLILRVGTW